MKRYTEREKTRFDHSWEIRRACGLKDFTDAEEEFAEWVAARSWTSRGRPEGDFPDAVGWLREREVLLPGVTTLARLVASVRDETAQRLWGALEALLTAGQRHALDQLVEVPTGAGVGSGAVAQGSAAAGAARRSSRPWTRSRRSGPGAGELDAEALVPPRRLAELARYGMTADASALRRHRTAGGWRRCWPRSGTWRPSRSTTPWSCSTC